MRSHIKSIALMTLLISANAFAWECPIREELEQTVSEIEELPSYAFEFRIAALSLVQNAEKSVDFWEENIADKMANCSNAIYLNQNAKKLIKHAKTIYYKEGSDKDCGAGVNSSTLEKTRPEIDLPLEIQAGSNAAHY